MKKGSINPHLYKAETRKCLVCEKEFRAIKDFKEKKQKYCSADCYRNHWSKKIRPKMKKRIAPKGEDNPAWKGEKVGYWGIHVWVYNNYGKPKKCEDCGSEKEKKYEWASVEHKYLRDRSNWKRLCTKCHRKMDYNLKN